MLQLADNYEQVGSSTRQKKFAPQLDLVALARILYRRWRLIAAIVAIGVVLGSVYMAVAPRRYTAEFAILVEQGKAPNSLLSRDMTPVDHLMDPGVVESQVEVLKSDSVVLSTVRALDLVNDPTVMEQGSWISELINAIGSFFSSKGDKISAADLEQLAVENVEATYKTSRLGVTYVVQGSYTNTDPVRAAKIANGLASAYLDSQLEARYDSSRRQAEWLQSRLKTLREQTSAAELAVQVFKAENGVVDTARGLISDQQLTDASTQLTTAHNETNAAKANLDRIQQILTGGDAVNATVPDALKDDVLNRLRSQYLDLAARAADLANRAGQQHASVLNLRNQMNTANQAARDELGRIAESLKSTYEQALDKEKALEQDYRRAVAKSDVTSKLQVKLRDLESTAQTYRNLYDNMLDKLQSTTQEQSSPDDSARIITPASVPFKPSSPKLLIVMAASLVGSFVLGGGLAIAMDLLTAVFKTADDVKFYGGLECIGILPSIKITRGMKRAAAESASAGIILGDRSPIARHTLQAPFSRFTETVRSVKVSMDIARASRHGAVTGIVSSVPKEGKTTFASNLALVTAQMGHRTLLIDGDLHNPALTRTLYPKASAGLIELIEGTATIENVIVKDTITGLYFLPTVLRERKPNVVSLLSSDQMSRILEQAREMFEYTIIDLPPVVPVVDVKATATMFDNFIFVIEWGKTSREVVRDALLTSEQMRDRVIGVVLNKADAAELKRIESYRGPAYDAYYVDSVAT